MWGNGKTVGRVTCATVGTLGALLLVSACTGTTQGTAASQPTNTATAPGFVSATTQPTTTAPAPTGSLTGTANGSANGTAAAAGGGTPRCHTKDLSVALGPKKSTNTDQSVQGELGALDHEEVPVIYTNISGHACTMFGFGGVDLHGPSDPPGAQGAKPQGPVFSVPRDALTPATVLVPPSGHAHSAIDYLVSDAAVKWQPTSIVVTPPDETTQLSAAWNTGDPVLLDSEGGVGEPSLRPVTAGS